MNELFGTIEKIAQHNTEKVLKAFKDCRVSESVLHGTTGYGYDDRGREILENVYAQVFGAEDALVRLTFVNGTHAIATALFGVLRPNDTILSVSGKPYDTLAKTFGLSGKTGEGSLADFNILYKQIDLLPSGVPDIKAIKEAVLSDSTIKMVYIQRSRGYTDRKTLTIEEIAEITAEVKALNSNIIVFVDNCYGEFVREKEPTDVGADLIAGSLIKNPGGGLARTGGYICGKKHLVELCGYRLTAVGIGKECGATLDELRLMFQGFFLAPHIVSQAVKTAVYAAKVFSDAGFCVSPKSEEIREDIIQTIKFGEKEPLLAFCRGIQSGSPIDSFVTPEPWAMPGYDCEVIMAAGAFVSGSSIELSADAPIKPPFIAYMQGGLTFESGKAAVDTALKFIKNKEWR